MLLTFLRTQYSWRRLMPTVALLAKYTPVEMVALGDWQSKSELPHKATMPLPTHYAGSRDLVSMRLKHLSLGLAHRLGEFDAWELATPDAITAAVDATKPEVQRAVSLDKHSLWDRPMSAAAAQRAFAFSRERAAITKEAQVSSKRSSSVMPPSINGKVVTRFLRNGTSKHGCLPCRRGHLRRGSSLCHPPGHRSCMWGQASCPSLFGEAAFGGRRC